MSEGMPESPAGVATQCSHPWATEDRLALLPAVLEEIRI
jgi:hypothetical protein